MSREIKFRAWQSDGDFWISWEDLVKADAEQYYAENFEVMPIGLLLNGDHSTITMCQYTGLKDKNGKEIYEGDIVKSPWECGELAAPILWDDEEYSVFWNGGYSLSRLEENGCEVIGNIYENPELLEVPNE